MKPNNTHQSELQSLAPTLWVMRGQASGFEVPEGYFNRLPEQLKVRMECEENSEAEELNTAKANKFAVPPGYFATLEQRIRERIEAESTEAALPELLAKLPKQSGFEVPSGYFEQRTQKPQTTEKQPTATTVPIWRNVLRISAAAAAIALLAVLLWPENTDNPQLAELSGSEIDAYIDLSTGLEVPTEEASSWALFSSETAEDSLFAAFNTADIIDYLAQEPALYSTELELTENEASTLETLDEETILDYLETQDLDLEEIYSL